MAHHSYLSPDGKWVLIVLMDSQGSIGRCRLLPFEGTAPEQAIGPEGASCTTAAWSPDGKWMYMSTNKGGRFHIWRQAFPNGEPEQVTSGPTQEEGIAMERDGRSLLTSVGTQDSTIWIHDEKGEHQISSEGDACCATYSADGSSLFYSKKMGQDEGAELWRTDLASGRGERLLPGYNVEPGFPGANFAVARDETIALVKKNNKGVLHIWIAAADHRNSPREIEATTNEDSPFFLPSGDLIYRGAENGKHYVYTRKADGSGTRKVLPQPILDLAGISPDGRWIAASVRNDSDKDHPSRTVAFPAQGGEPVPVCTSLCVGLWTLDGKYMLINFAVKGADEMAALLPVNATGLPTLPPNGYGNMEDVKAGAKNIVLPTGADAALGAQKYSYTRMTIRRNIYRVPIM